MNKRESARLRGSDKSRDFRLRMLIPGIFLILLIVLIGFLPTEVVMQATVIGVVGLLSGGTVGLLTGIRGPSWLIYVLIVAGIALLLVLPSPWRSLALLSVPVSALGFAMGKEIAFYRFNSSHEVSETTWVVAGEAIADVKGAKSIASLKLNGWESIQDGRFVVSLGHRRFEAGGSAVDGFIVHTAVDARDLATMSVLTRFPHEDEEVSIALDAHGLRAWVPLGVMVPTNVAAGALEAFFETQGALSLDGWAWESGAQAQELRFFDESS
ncbi:MULTISPECIES: hypothetical protein [unclassified Arthrobacter]|uniref:hypothetical protein n=1 Tax=unclassified Arthrobacter TaxID=235627 RepID=UPI002E1312C3|nr:MULTISPECIES: hypothetical protein [unclassified Arthrobacter]